MKSSRKRKVTAAFFAAAALGGVAHAAPTLNMNDLVGSNTTTESTTQATTNVGAPVVRPVVTQPTQPTPPITQTTVVTQQQASVGSAQVQQTVPMQPQPLMQAQTVRQQTVTTQAPPKVTPLIPRVRPVPVTDTAKALSQQHMTVSQPQYVVNKQTNTVMEPTLAMHSLMNVQRKTEPVTVQKQVDGKQQIQTTQVQRTPVVVQEQSTMPLTVANTTTTKPVVAKQKLTIRDIQRAERERIAQLEAEEAAKQSGVVQVNQQKMVAQKQAEAQRQAAILGEQQRIAQQQAEAQLQAAMQAEQQRIAQQQAEAQRQAAILDEQQRQMALQAEQQRIAQQQAEAQRQAALRAEQERIAAQQAEQARIAEAQRQAAEQERLRVQEEQRRIAAQQAEKQRIAAERAEAQRQAALKAEQERIAAQQAEQQRIAAEQAEAQRQAALKAEQERIAAQQAEQQRLAAEQLAKEEAEAAAKAQAEAEAKAKAQAEAEAKAKTEAEAAAKAEAEAKAKAQAEAEEKAKAEANVQESKLPQSYIDARNEASTKGSAVVEEKDILSQPMEPPLQADASSKISLAFDVKNYESMSTTVDNKEIKYRAFEYIPYVANPIDIDQQYMNIYVPEEYFNNGTVNGYNTQTAPIFMPNAVGGYMPSQAMTPKVENGKPNSVVYALSRGYVVASPATRGRTNKASDGNFIGKAPAVIVDLQAATAYLHANDSTMPGNANRIITNGTSAGGAVSLLQGAAGNSSDFQPYLQALGAATAATNVYAVSAYAPITNLDAADMAYEWSYNGITSSNKVSMSHDDVAYSNLLNEHFPDYVNNLQLHDSVGRVLKLDKNGNGTFKNYVKEFIVAAANKAQAKGTDLSKHTYLVRDNKTGTIKDINWEAYNRFVSRSKAPGAFDSRSNDSGENNLFGTSTTDNNHFTITAALHDTTSNPEAYVQNAKVVTMMNPMNYLGSPAATNAQFYRIRYGTADSNTSVAIPLIVGTRAQNLGYKVDMATPFNVDHSGDYDLDELFNWMDNIVKNGR